MRETCKKVAEATRQRAAVLAHLFRVLRDRLGEEEAAALMSEAIHSYGKEKSRASYSLIARSGNLQQAAGEFAGPDPVKQYQFAPRVVSLNENEAVISMSACPLVDQWRDMGLAADDIALLCRIARSVDFGTWEGALGFRLIFEGTRGEGKDECILRIGRTKP